MHWALQRLPSLQKRAYLAKYLVPEPVPQEFMQDEVSQQPPHTPAARLSLPLLRTISKQTNNQHNQHPPPLQTTCCQNWLRVGA